MSNIIITVHTTIPLFPVSCVTLSTNKSQEGSMHSNQHPPLFLVAVPLVLLLLGLQHSTIMAAAATTTRRLSSKVMTSSTMMPGWSFLPPSASMAREGTMTKNAGTAWMMPRQHQQRRSISSISSISGVGSTRSRSTFLMWGEEDANESRQQKPGETFSHYFIIYCSAGMDSVLFPCLKYYIALLHLYLFDCFVLFDQEMNFKKGAGQTCV